MPCTGRDVAVVARHRLGEPAQRAGAQPAQHDAGLPRLAQGDVEPVRAQHAHQADHAAAADVHEVLLEQVRRARRRSRSRAGTARRARTRSGSPGSAGRSGRCSGRRRPEAVGRKQTFGRSRPAAAARPEHVVVEQRVPGLHGEPAAAEGDDLAWTRHGAKRRDRARSAREFRARGRAALDRVSAGLATRRTPPAVAAAPPSRAALSRRSASAAPARWRRSCCVSSNMPRFWTEARPW